MHFHSWGDWYTIEKGTYRYDAGYGDHTVWFNVQHRTCVQCGKTQLRTATTELLGDAIAPKIQKASDV